MYFYVVYRDVDDIVNKMLKYIVGCILICNYMIYNDLKSCR